MNKKDFSKYVGDTHSGKGDLIIDNKKVAEVSFEVTVGTKLPWNKSIIAYGEISGINITDKDFKVPSELESIVKTIEFIISGTLDLGDKKIDTEFSGWFDGYPEFIVHNAGDIFKRL